MNYTPTPPTWTIPPALRALRRWAVWRERKKKRGGATREAVHPVSGKALSAKRPEEWATYDEVVGRPKGGKPVGGIGLLVTAEDGLAFILNADPEVPVQLGS